MSEQEARKYTSICMLREEIRRDMEDYKLLHTRISLYSTLDQKFEDGDLFIGWYSGEDNCWDEDNNAPERAFSDEANWYTKYLAKRLKQNLTKLKELMEQNNE
jgi:hypothetical protein